MDQNLVNSVADTALKLDNSPNRGDTLTRLIIVIALVGLAAYFLYIVQLNYQQSNTIQQKMLENSNKLIEITKDQTAIQSEILRLVRKYDDKN